ncbi:HdeD family acid-resistance protein [Roseomonas sp. BN140053]|uniref:HdeD family acid-resistance protein n=1 Tax=Roseomonas sp. BN140053 TaxID=3391898 RepID=UPI0039EAECBA
MTLSPTAPGAPGGPVPDRPSVAGMSALLARNWWAIGLRGAFAILFGLVALLVPFATVASLVLVFAAYMLADGIFAIVAGVRAAARHERWGLLILEGVVDLLAGVVAFLMPGLTVLLLVTLLGIWSVVSGALMIFAAFRLQGGHGRWLLALSGLVSVVWGVLLYLSPVAGALVLTWWLGGYALAFGVVLLVLAFRLRARRGAVPPAGALPR